MRWKNGLNMLDFEKTYTLPFKFEIPNYIQEFLNKFFLIKSWVKFVKRYLYLNLKSQKLLEVSNILPEHNYILWINISAPSLGDSLMDLSSRIFLNGKKVDLFTDKKNSDLYKDDLIFSKIYTEKKYVVQNKYDLVIIDSYSTRSIHIKADIARLIPFVGMFGFFNGPEVNRVLFSFHQMNKLLGYKKNESQINCMAKSTISVSNADKKIVQNFNLPMHFISIALGGEWSYRSYLNWNKVIKEIIEKDIDLNIVLLGSSNAKYISKEIAGEFPHYNIFDCVDQFTFNQTSQIIKKSQILLCCDGGLMHAANSVNTPIVALLARLSSEMQLTDSVKAFSLYDKNNVNNILVQDVLMKYEEASNFVRIHRLDE